MITMKEILKDVDFNSLSPEIQNNLNDLLEKVNRLRTAYGKPMKVTSGLRSMVDHLRIYAQKGITDKSKIPMKSKHLSGQACDFGDADNALKAFIRGCTEEELDYYGLYFESFEHTPNWLHVQSVPPKSGKRFFAP